MNHCVLLLLENTQVFLQTLPLTHSTLISRILITYIRLFDITLNCLHNYIMIMIDNVFHSFCSLRFFE